MDKLLDLENERRLEARFEKQMFCLQHKKRCAECDGKDELGQDCKYYKGGDIIENRKDNIRRD